MAECRTWLLAYIYADAVAEAPIHFLLGHLITGFISELFPQDAQW